MFQCFHVNTRPEKEKQNAVFMHALMLNSEEIFIHVGEDSDKFRKHMINIFTDATGAKLHKAIEELYRTLLKYPGFADTARAIRLTAENSRALDGIADEEEMNAMRDRWLRYLHRTRITEKLPDQQPGNNATGPGFISLPVFYATNRNPIKGTVKRSFGTERAEEVSWGVVWLSMADSNGYGDTDHPFWRFSPNRSGAHASKIVHQSSMPLTEECVYKLGKVMHSINEKECILFVHGYNTTMSNACKRMAQVAYTGNFQGPSFVFSWPSNQSVASYTADEANVMWAIADFVRTLQFLMNNMGMQKVHLLGHSMGSRLVIYSLLRMHPSEFLPHSAKIGRVVLAAPDFDTGEFMYLAEDIMGRCERLTLYCSAEDQALHASRSVHGGYPRLGDFRGFQEMARNPRMVSLQKMDAIDTTGTDNSFFRHSYVFNACGIIIDCCLVLRVGLHPRERKALALARLPSGIEYWTFETAPVISSRDLFGKLSLLIRSTKMKEFSSAGILLTASSSVNSVGNTSEGKVALEEEREKGIEEVAVAGEDMAVTDELDDVAAPKLLHSVGKVFMDDFGFDLELISGETLQVQQDRVEEDGGNDVKLPSDVNQVMLRSLSKSKSSIYVATKHKMRKTFSMRH